MKLLIFCLPLVLRVSLYYIFIRILFYQNQIIATRPKPAAPKYTFELGMKTENLFYRDALNCSDYFLNIHRNALNQKMGVIPIQLNLQNMRLLPLPYMQTNLSASSRCFFVQHISPIFYMTTKMIQKQAFVMDIVDIFTHNHKCMNITKRCPRQSLWKF